MYIHIYMYMYYPSRNPQSSNLHLEAYRQGPSETEEPSESFDVKGAPAAKCGLRLRDLIRVVMAGTYTKQSSV